MNEEFEIKSLLWLIVAVILINVDDNITGFPFIMGIGIIIYLLIEYFAINDKKQKENGNTKN